MRKVPYARFYVGLLLIDFICIIQGYCNDTGKLFRCQGATIDMVKCAIRIHNNNLKRGRKPYTKFNPEPTKTGNKMTFVWTIAEQ